MRIDRVSVKYYSRRMLMTVDVPTLLATLFDAYGDDLHLEFEPMGEAERREATDAAGRVPIIQVRFQVFEIRQGSGPRRREDLERAAVSRGTK